MIHDPMAMKLDIMAHLYDVYFVYFLVPFLSITLRMVTVCQLMVLNRLWYKFLDLFWGVVPRMFLFPTSMPVSQPDITLPFWAFKFASIMNTSSWSQTLKWKSLIPYHSLHIFNNPFNMLSGPFVKIFLHLFPIQPT